MRRERERAGGEWVKNSGRERNFSRSKIGLERIKNKIRKDGLFDIKFIHLLKKKIQVHLPAKQERNGVF